MQAEYILNFVHFSKLNTKDFTHLLEKMFKPSLQILSIIYFTTSPWEILYTLNKFSFLLINKFLKNRGFFSHRSIFCVLQILQNYGRKYYRVENTMNFTDFGARIHSNWKFLMLQFVQFVQDNYLHVRYILDFVDR